MSIPELMTKVVKFGLKPECIEELKNIRNQAVREASGEPIRKSHLKIILDPEAWATSPASMLFFRNLQSLAGESHTVRKEIVTRGPIAGSHRIRLAGAGAEELLLICSEEEAFPRKRSE